MLAAMGGSGSELDVTGSESVLPKLYCVVDSRAVVGGVARGRGLAPINVAIYFSV
jgi:hypothetical protein